MRLRELWIEHFKNLRDLRIDFQEDSPYTVLVGENGAGKSNLIEAIATIFRNLDLDEKSALTYTIEYEVREVQVRVHAVKGRWPEFYLKDLAANDGLFPEDDGAAFKATSRRTFMELDANGRPRYRPAFVFGYYSGPSDRLKRVFEKHQERFYSAIIKPLDKSGRSTRRDPNELRRLFYAQNLHGQFALLSFFMNQESDGDADRSFIKERMQIDGLDSVLFVLHQPNWARKSRGDERFWGAEGEVQEFLGRLYDSAYLPLRMDRRYVTGLTKAQSVEHLYLFLKDAPSLADVYQQYGDQYRFFTALESTHLSRLLLEVRTRVRMTAEAGGGEVNYRDLSEGEQQLLLVLGLLKFTARDEALFLLDEPDTHLNPAWSVEYLDFLNHFMAMRERADSCHIVMNTHDPLVFSRLDRSEVVIMTRDETGVARASVPDQSPKGMGVGAILTSDLFRLRSTLDPETQHDLDRQRSLAMSDRTPAENDELRELNARLRRLGLTMAARDPLYELFVRAWTRSEDPAWLETPELSPDEREARERLADAIVAELREEVRRS
ncbi:AAA family ATPase [Micromonospora sp. NPDC047557]|uniref:AAA family ATPase n=1 Tax=Micromonospora sp. NPDC047557 TaxID=3364250 RepID=UPI003721CDA7